jgi:hypothetical protein
MTARDDDEYRRLASQVNLLGMDSLNELDRWRWDDFCSKRRRAAAREQNAVAELRAEMHGEIARLRSELQQQHEISTEAVGTAIGQYGERVFTDAEELTRELRHDLVMLIEKRFSELLTRIDTVGSQAPSEPRKDFKFASEQQAGDTKQADPEPSSSEVVYKARLN